MPNDPIDEVTTLIQRAEDASIPIAEVCRKAKVAQSTPSRWKAGIWEPRPRTLRRMCAALDELVAAKREPVPVEA